jgi:hypothetical protein
MATRTEQDAKEHLDAAYRAFLKEQDALKKNQAGRNLIRAIFGDDAIAHSTR